MTVSLRHEEKKDQYSNIQFFVKYDEIFSSYHHPVLPSMGFLFMLKFKRRLRLKTQANGKVELAEIKCLDQAKINKLFSGRLFSFLFRRFSFLFGNVNYPYTVFVNNHTICKRTLNT